MRDRDDHVYVHLVWATWDRQPWLTPEVEPTLHACVRDQCRRLGAEVRALGSVPDHLHLLVRLPTPVAVADLVKQVKGASSHLINATGRDRDALFRWQGGYGAYSVSRSDLERVQQYIASQKARHREWTQDDSG